MSTNRERLAASIVLACFAVLVFATVPELVVASNLDDAMVAIVEEVRTCLNTRGESAVAVGGFSGPSSSSAGSQIKAALTDRLQNAEIQVDNLAQLQVRGSFAWSTDPFPVVSIAVELVDHAGNPLPDFRKQVVVDPVVDVVHLLGVTTHLSRKADDKTREEVIQRRDEQLARDIEEPSFTLTGTTIVSATSDSPYRVEVLLHDGNSLTPVPVEFASGFALVSLSEGQEYIVRLYNASAIDVGVKLTIDGIDAFEYCRRSDLRSKGRWAIPAGEVVSVEGWCVSDRKSLAFRVPDAQDSAITGLKRGASGMGTITASFFPAWTGDEIPEEELIGRLRVGFLGVNAASYTRMSEVGPTLLAAVSVRYEKPNHPVSLPVTASPKP